MSYATQLAAAQSIITRKGAQCTWRQIRTNADANEPWNEEEPDYTDYTVNIVFLPFDSTARRMLGYDTNTAIPLGTMVGYMPGQTFEPVLADQVIVGTRTYTVRSIDMINPDMALDVLYVMELRR